MQKKNQFLTTLGILLCSFSAFSGERNYIRVLSFDSYDLLLLKTEQEKETTPDCYLVVLDGVRLANDDLAEKQSLALSPFCSIDKVISEVLPLLALINDDKGLGSEETKVTKIYSWKLSKEAYPISTVAQTKDTRPIRFASAFVRVEISTNKDNRSKKTTEKKNIRIGEIPENS